jgi:hypothetical protein
LFVCGLAALCIALFAWVGVSNAQAPGVRPVTISIATEKLSQTPIDRNIYGAVLDEPARRLVCTIVYGGPTELAVRLDLRAYKRLRPAAKLITLASESLESRSDFHTPNVIVQKEATVSGTEGIYAMKLPRYSVTKFVFELE